MPRAPTAHLAGGRPYSLVLQSCGSLYGLYKDVVLWWQVPGSEDLELPDVLGHEVTQVTPELAPGEWGFTVPCSVCLGSKFRTS